MIKYLSKILLSIIVFCTGIILVNARTLNTETDIDNISWVIGTHLFTTKTTLDTRKIMLASKTINSDDINDMIIYYKSIWGYWQDANTGDKLEIANTKQITHKDLVPFDDKLTIDFDANGGTGSMSTQYIDFSESSALNGNTFTKDNYSFKCWNTKADGTGTTYYDYQIITNNYNDGGSLTLYAQWELLETMITFNNLSYDSVSNVDQPDQIEMFIMESKDGRIAWFAIEDGSWYVNQQISNSESNKISYAYRYVFENNKWKFAVSDEDKFKKYIDDLDTFTLYNYRVLSPEEAALVNEEYDIYRDSDNYKFLSTEEINKIVTITNVS